MKTLKLETIGQLVGSKIWFVVAWSQKNADLYAAHRQFVLGRKLYVGTQRRRHSS